MDYVTKTFQDVSHYSETEQIRFLKRFPSNVFFCPQESAPQFREIMAFSCMFSGMRIENFAKSLNVSSYILQKWLDGEDMPREQTRHGFALKAIQTALHHHNIRPLYG